MKVKSGYTREFPDPPRARAGEVVVFERYDEKNPAWFFGRDAGGRSGFFPVGWFQLDGIGKAATALRDYDATELTVATGDRVEVDEEYGDWLLVSMQGRRGWIPKESVH